MAACLQSLPGCRVDNIVKHWTGKHSLIHGEGKTRIHNCETHCKRSGSAVVAMHSKFNRLKTQSFRHNFLPEMFRWVVIM